MDYGANYIAFCGPFVWFHGFTFLCICNKKLVGGSQFIQAQLQKVSSKADDIGHGKSYVRRAANVDVPLDVPPLQKSNNPETLAEL